MVQVTNFLLRWLFLCRLVDDRAEVQTWPYRRPGYYEHPPPHHQQQQQQAQQQQQHQQHPKQQIQNVHRHHEPPPPHHQNQKPPTPPNSNNILLDDDDSIDIPTYRESVIRSLTSYPPGSSERLQRLEELRLRVVHEFAQRLMNADEVIRRGSDHQTIGIGDESEADDVGATTGGGGAKDSSHDNMYDVRFDIDESIQDEFGQFMHQEHSQGTYELGKQHSNLWKRFNFLRGHHEEDATSNTDNEESSFSSTLSSSVHNPLQGLQPEQVEASLASAHKLLNEAREFLPQLVSTVLHSPPSLLPETSLAPDPISSLRSLLIHRCKTTPSLGIELCWLLEAEVGRKWKALFEHRQQTGKRLILIVQADIAAAIATIGAEKASAFNLLQDVEMATAFGMERSVDNHQLYHQSIASTSAAASAALGGDPATSSRPPRAISDLRCRHFGDSMHFVDRLTQISLDLRHVPPVHRQSHLQMRLAELNQRLCRRMATRGRISIDVEDLDMHQHGQQHYGHSSPVPHWSEENIREDMIKHSVHFPMEPQSVCWPGSSTTSQTQQDTTSTSGGGGVRPTISNFEHPPKHNGVVRALRILPQNCHVLDSAQRCPYLVRMEVAETGLDADDARLYATDVDGVGVAIEEALGSGMHHHQHHGGFAHCEIPPELMREQHVHQRGVADTAHAFSGDDSTLPKNGGMQDQQSAFEPTMGVGQSASSGSFSPSQIPLQHDGAMNTENKPVLASRGGYQEGYDGYYAPPPDMHSSFDMVREQHYEELHHELRQQRENEFNPPDPSLAGGASSNQHTTGAALLNKVFGHPWSEECNTIRAESPYGNLPGWKLASFIIKAGEDIRKEALVMQVMSKLWTWFREEIPSELRPYLRPYTIMCVGGDAGIVECLPDVKSVNEVKRETDGFTSLKEFFERAYGPPVQPPFRQNDKHCSIPNSYSTVSYEKARDNFLRSLVGYSVVCYILQIKDRHNANILMDREGHIMHIDFGFVLGETPKMGKVPLFSERAPFKLSAEFWEVIGGWSAFKRFCEMFEAAYAVASKHSDEICGLIESAIVNTVGGNAELARGIANGARGRMRMKDDVREQKMHIMNIVNDAVTSWGTSTYDWLQRSMHGYQ